jgi:hypothetical protein
MSYLVPRDLPAVNHRTWRDIDELNRIAHYLFTVIGIAPGLALIDATREVASNRQVFVRDRLISALCDHVSFTATGCTRARAA